MVIMTTVSFYLITVYTPTFGRTVLKLSESDALLVTMTIAVSNFVWLPVSGALSDRIGRKPILVAFTVLALLTAYPVLAWLVSAPSFGRMLEVELWLSFLYAGYNGAMVVALTEIVPATVRTAGFSLAYSLATTLGGSSLAISTFLIEQTGDKAAPGYRLSFAALCGLVATLALYRGRARQPAGPGKRDGLIDDGAIGVRGAHLEGLHLDVREEPIEPVPAFAREQPIGSSRHRYRARPRCSPPASPTRPS